MKPTLSPDDIVILFDLEPTAFDKTFNTKPEAELTDEQKQELRKSINKTIDRLKVFFDEYSFSIFTTPNLLSPAFIIPVEGFASLPKEEKEKVSVGIQHILLERVGYDFTVPHLESLVSNKEAKHKIMSAFFENPSEAVFERYNTTKTMLYSEIQLQVKSWLEQLRPEGDLSTTYSVEKQLDPFKLSALKLYQTQPYFYDENKNWWVWDKHKYEWVLVDETHIMILFDKWLVLADTEGSTTKAKLLESARRIGRTHKPKPIPPTWVQFGSKVYDIANKGRLVMEASPEYFFPCSINREVGEWVEGEDEKYLPTIHKLIKSWVKPKDVVRLYELIAFVTMRTGTPNAFFCLYSPPGHGKTTFVNLIKEFIGEDNSATTSMKRIKENTRFETSSWLNKLLIIMTEADNFDTLTNSGLLNDATSNGLVPVEFKGGKQINARIFGTFIYTTNHLLRVSKDNGFLRRIRVIDFVNEFDKDVDVLSQMSIPDWEFNNLAKKCLVLATRIYERGQFTGDKSMKERAEEYLERSKGPVEKFLDECCDITDADAKVKFDDFYAAFLRWSKEQGLDSLTPQRVSRTLRKLGFSKGLERWPVKTEQKTLTGEFDSKPFRTWYGIKLKCDENVEQSIEEKPEEEVVSSPVRKQSCADFICGLWSGNDEAVLFLKDIKDACVKAGFDEEKVVEVLNKLVEDGVLFFVGQGRLKLTK